MMQPGQNVFDGPEPRAQRQSAIAPGPAPHGFASQERFEMAERSKIAVGRQPTGRGPGNLWWRLTVYVGDSRDDLDRALDEALRLDGELQERTR
jgi:hypothetical protein